MADKQFKIEFVAAGSTSKLIDKLKNWIKQKQEKGTLEIFDPNRLYVQLYVYSSADVWVPIQNYILDRLGGLRGKTSGQSQSSGNLRDWHGFFAEAPLSFYSPNLFVSAMEYSYELLFGGIETLNFTIQIPYLTLTREMVSEMRNSPDLFPFPRLFDRVKLDYGYLSTDGDGLIISKEFVISRLPDFSYEDRLRSFSLSYTAISIPFVVSGLYRSTVNTGSSDYYNRIFGELLNSTEEKELPISEILLKLYHWLLDLAGQDENSFYRKATTLRFKVSGNMENISNLESFKNISVVKAKETSKSGEKTNKFVVAIDLGKDIGKIKDISEIFRPLEGVNRTDNLFDVWLQVLQNLLRIFLEKKFKKTCLVFGCTPVFSGDNNELILESNLVISDLPSDQSKSSTNQGFGGNDFLFGGDVLSNIRSNLFFIVSPDINFGQLYQVRERELFLSDSENKIELLFLPIYSFAISDFLRSNWALFYTPISAKVISKELVQNTDKPISTNEESEEKQEAVPASGSVGVPLKLIEIGTVFNPYIEPLNYIYIDPNYIPFYGGLALVGGVQHNLLGSISTTIKALWIYSGNTLVINREKFKSY